MGILSFIIFTPLAGALLVLILSSAQSKYFKIIALVATILQMIFGIMLFSDFKYGTQLLKTPDGTETVAYGINNPDTFQFVEKGDWISINLGNYGILDIDYYLAVDGLSITMILLSALVFFVSVIASWKIEKNLKGYFALFLLLDMAVVGVFCALDFFLFFMFWEIMLLPMYFLIGIWGGPRREYASIKFFLYTLVGSVFMLLVMVGLYFSVIDPALTAIQAGLVQPGADINAMKAAVLEVQKLLAEGKLSPAVQVHSFNMLHMMNTSNLVPGSIFAVGGEIFGYSARLIAFMALFLGFAIKVPMVPFHTWLPDAHVEAPTPISVILAGVLLKLGGYGMMRICYGIFPEGGVYFCYFIGLMGLISMVYGAFVCLAQTDLKKLIAYSSVSHMGYVLLGMASLETVGMNAAMFQMFNHGTISAMLFLLVGVIYDRTHDRQIPNYRGLATHMPQYTAMVMIAFFASLGLPGFSGFVSEAFTFVGAFNSTYIPKWMAMVGTITILLTAAYYLWTLQRMFFGEVWFKGGDHWRHELSEINRRELTALIPLAAVTVFLGIFPSACLDLMSTSIGYMTQATIENGHKLLEQVSQMAVK
ncbi:MAG: oxidoreductase [Bacteroidetes bacterium RIFCSPLOWO2_02_FULL_36_8]|nr:MAG: oxidoreductase [Bacteroidetes bacterium RIFCSPLOWO2_02_FULL_36_8]OFY70423.1 MAG: oxidoreductase [Bacteroidetes bacterium RIFCSPLOWO2_12_FULL_37_12]